MLSPKLAKEAIETGHSATCTGENGCIHASGLAGCREEIKEDIFNATLVGIQVGGPKMIGDAIWNAGFHAGYRAAQLVAQANKGKGKAN